jgi:hypothetical protein
MALTGHTERLPVSGWRCGQDGSKICNNFWPKLTPTSVIRNYRGISPRKRQVAPIDRSVLSRATARS